MMDINYELYKVFYYVASSLSFSEASKQLYISQSAVSQSIKALEKETGSGPVYPEYKESPAHSGRGDPSAPCGTGHESDQKRRKPASGIRLHRRSDPNRGK